jgi:hypothetical protein
MERIAQALPTPARAYTARMAMKTGGRQGAISRYPRALLLVASLIVLYGACSKPPPPAAGGSCKGQDGSFACADHNTALFCKDSVWNAAACRGVKGCTNTAGRVDCDRSIARIGDPCYGAPVYSSIMGLWNPACDEKLSTLLACKDGAFVLDRSCRGAGGCNPEQASTGLSPELGCDRSIASEGEPCNYEFITDGWGACSADKKTALACDKDEHGKYVVSAVCAGPKGCEAAARMDPRCDDGVVVEGGPCGPGNRVACTADAHAVLKCDAKARVYAVDEVCDANEVCVTDDYARRAECKRKRN